MTETARAFQSGGRAGARPDQPCLRLRGELRPLCGGGRPDAGNEHHALSRAEGPGRVSAEMAGWQPVVPAAESGHAEDLCFRAGVGKRPDSLADRRISCPDGRIERCFDLADVFLTDEAIEFPKAAETTVDALGQWKQKEWPGKIPSEEAMKDFLQARVGKRIAAPAGTEPLRRLYGAPVRSHWIFPRPEGKRALVSGRPGRLCVLLHRRVRGNARRGGLDPRRGRPDGRSARPEGPLRPGL